MIGIIKNIHEIFVLIKMTGEIEKINYYDLI